MTQPANEDTLYRRVNLGKGGYISSSQTGETTIETPEGTILFTPVNSEQPPKPGERIFKDGEIVILMAPHSFENEGISSGDVGAVNLGYQSSPGHWRMDVRFLTKENGLVYRGVEQEKLTKAIVLHVRKFTEGLIYLNLGKDAVIDKQAEKITDLEVKLRQAEQWLEEKRTRLTEQGRSLEEEKGKVAQLEEQLKKTPRGPLYEAIGRIENRLSELEMVIVKPPPTFAAPFNKGRLLMYGPSTYAEHVIYADGSKPKSVAIDWSVGSMDNITTTDQSGKDYWHFDNGSHKPTIARPRFDIQRSLFMLP